MLHYNFSRMLFGFLSLSILYKFHFCLVGHAMPTGKTASSVILFMVNQHDAVKVAAFSSTSKQMMPWVQYLAN